VPLLQGKINALTARSRGNRPVPAEHADAVFVDDVPESCSRPRKSVFADEQVPRPKGWRALENQNGPQ
jgi:hypothetical protein